MKNNININRDSNFFSNHTCQTACAFLAANLLFAYNTAHSIPPTVAPSTVRTSTLGSSSTSTDSEYYSQKLRELRTLACSILENASKTSTNDLVQQARKALESENNSSSTSSERKRTIEKDLQRLTALESEITAVNQRKYRKANPWAIDKISDKTKITEGAVIGKGGFGQIYQAMAKTGNSQIDIVIKQGEQDNLNEEGKIGKQLTAKRTAIHKDSLLSSKQGLEMLVIPKILENGTLIQKMIHGLDGYDAIFDFEKQTASNSPFLNGYVDDPQKAIQRICGLALGLHGLHQAWYVHHDLKLKNIIIEKTEDQEDLFRIRIIDFGIASHVGEENLKRSENYAPEFIETKQAQTSYDIYCLGTILPALLFGKSTENWHMYEPFLSNLFLPSRFINKYRQLIKDTCETEGKIAMDQIILKQFQRMNKAMQNGINKSYPEQVLNRLAQMTADCLSMDPESRPTAEHILLALENMGLSDWSVGEYNIQNTHLTPKNVRIQGNFWWISRDEP